MSVTTIGKGTLRCPSPPQKRMASSGQTGDYTPLSHNPEKHPNLHLLKHRRHGRRPMPPKAIDPSVADLPTEVRTHILQREAVGFGVDAVCTYDIEYRT